MSQETGTELGLQVALGLFIYIFLLDSEFSA